MDYVSYVMKMQEVAPVELDQSKRKKEENVNPMEQMTVPFVRVLLNDGNCISQIAASIFSILESFVPEPRNVLHPFHMKELQAEEKMITAGTASAAAGAARLASYLSSGGAGITAASVNSSSQSPSPSPH